MKADLERLLISEAELLELTGFDRQKILLSCQMNPRQIIIHRAICSGIGVIAFAVFASIFLSALRLAGTILLISLLLGGLGVTIELAEVAVVCFGIALAAAIYFLYVLMSAPLGLICLCLILAVTSGVLAWFLIQWIDQRWHKSKQSNLQIPRVVMRLFTEVDKCNKVVRDIDVFDQLQEAGNTIKLESRESAIAALRMTRNDITRALKTERILREHPDFHPDHFDIDLTAFESMQMGSNAQEYGRIFNTTLKIAINVQKTMAELQQLS
ncbi:MAG TPA: hypothetical protein DCZ88_16055 [Pseudanabaena sp.]|nr:hypothetical protein [Pseudanabaena sp.]